MDIKVGDFVKSNDDKYWVVLYTLTKCQENERILICFRDGVRKSFHDSSVKRVRV